MHQIHNQNDNKTIRHKMTEVFRDIFKNLSWNFLMI